MSIVLLIATLLADLVVGMAAMKMAKAAQSSQTAQTTTNTNVLALLSKHSDTLNNHEYRIIVLERQAA